MLKIIARILLLLVVVFLLWFIWQWGVCRKWCPQGMSLRIYRKTGTPAGKDEYAQEGQKGVQGRLLGPGRHLGIDPWRYEVEKVTDFVILPRKIGVVKSNIGKDLPPGRFLADDGEKGTRKRVLTPGAWRINTFGQEVTEADATVIKPGYVGVQTLREGAEKGVLDTVLQAGYYNINPFEIRVDEVEIGYRVWDIRSERRVVEIVEEGIKKKVDRVVEGTGVAFPLADGKQMHLDFTVVWGIFPADAPRIIKDYGNVAMVEDKIIEPQVLSICKNAGSNLTTQQFIEGTTRENFQNAVTDALQKMGEQKGIHFLIALVRGFHVSEDIRNTIQARMLAEEEKITLAIEKGRETVNAKLEEAKRMVDVAIKDFGAETEALVQDELEKGKKRAASTRAEADRNVAELEKKTAEKTAEIVKTVGKAEAEVIQATKEAEATLYKLLVDAYGGPAVYNMATFAEQLPEGIEIEYRYAGPGTFWTDKDSGSLSQKALMKLLDQAVRGEQAPKQEDW